MSGACSCEAWVREQPIPGKIIVLKCSSCRTEYTLYPNGQIAYEQRTGIDTSSRLCM
jgi:hypothetical protein